MERRLRSSNYNALGSESWISREWCAGIGTLLWKVLGWAEQSLECVCVCVCVCVCGWGLAKALQTHKGSGRILVNITGQSRKRPPPKKFPCRLAEVRSFRGSSHFFLIFWVFFGRVFLLGDLFTEGKDPEGNGHFVGGVEGAWIRTHFAFLHA